jgi:NhaA family Na+:H+ antiporter
VEKKLKTIARSLHPKRVVSFLETFLEDESVGGKLILAAALLSLVVVNSPLNDQYEAFWHLPLSIGLGSWSLSLDLRHWVNEGLMAFFFLVVGLEIKRELVKGELKNKKTAILPIGAAIGGMVLPALIYLFFNWDVEKAVQGWGIPIATDIAFAVAVLSLLGSRVPLSLKVFLLTLAIADDIGAIFVIALFYAEIINYWYLGASAVLLVGIYLFRHRLSKQIYVVSGLGVLLWVTTHLSGIHASIVGAAMGFLAPISGARASVGVSEKVERLLLPVTTLFVLPLFAFANAGFTVSTDALSTNQSVLWGVVLGLIAGKVLGISLASWLLVKLKLAELPKDIAWKQVIGIAFIAGIGFTVSIFITELAFKDDQALINTAKIGIFIASALSALVGYMILRVAQPRHTYNITK